MANNNSGRDKNEKDLVCSFCGKHQDEVERMIIGPGVNICSECIGLCADLLSDKPDHPGSNSSAPAAAAPAGRVSSPQMISPSTSRPPQRSRRVWTSMSSVRTRPSVCWPSRSTTIISAS